MEAAIAGLMSHLLPKNNWSELRVLSSVSEAFIKPLVQGLGFRVRPRLEFRSWAAYINSVSLHL